MQKIQPHPTTHNRDNNNRTNTKPTNVHKFPQREDRPLLLVKSSSVHYCPFSSNSRIHTGSLSGWTFSMAGLSRRAVTLRVARHPFGSRITVDMEIRCSKNTSQGSTMRGVCNEWVWCPPSTQDSRQFHYYAMLRGECLCAMMGERVGRCSCEADGIDKSPSPSCRYFTPSSMAYNCRDGKVTNC